MKKRLFAGTLALLMIIGLLPVSSMLKKPVEAQAASTTKSYITNDIVGKVKKNTFLADNQSSNFFKVVDSNISNGKMDNKTGLKLDPDAKEGISFEIKSDSAEVSIEWGINESAKTGTIAIYNEKNETVASNVNADKGKNQTDKFTINGNGTYKIVNASTSASTSGSTVVIKVTVTVPAYTININDSNANEISKEVIVGEGENIPLKAATENNFLYWKTSYGRIVSREPNPSTPLTAYYDETYTAVYGSDTTVYYMTAYDQIYKSVAVESGTFDSSSEPAGPIRYGYKFKGWSMSASDIQAEIKSGTKKIFVNPQYDSVITTKYTVTVNKTALTDDEVSVDTEYGFNEVATASTSSTEFAYWKDGKTGKVLSYNSTYYFFVNDNIEVVAVNKSEASYEAKPVISLVYNGADEDGNSVVIFEYTVPSDYTVKFAGVYASPNSSNLTEKSAEFVDGGVFNSKNTYKYTITKTKGMGRWYVMPILKYEYKDSTGEIKSESITLNYVTF